MAGGLFSPSADGRPKPTPPKNLRIFNTLATDQRCAMMRMLSAILLFVCVANIGRAQHADTLQQQIINEAARAFDLAFQDPYAAQKIAKRMLAKSEEIGDELAAANAYNSLGWSYFHLGELDSAIVQLQHAKALFAVKARPKEVIQVAINLSEVYLRRSGYQAALTLVLEADSVNQLLGDAALQTDLYRQFAILYRELGSFDKATSYFLLAMDGFLEQDDLFRYVNTGISLSILYRKKNQWSESLNLLQNLDERSNLSALSDYQRAMVNENLGETYFGMGDYANALLHFEKAYDLFDKLALGGDLAYEALNIGKSHRQLGNWDAAERYLLQADQLTDSLALINYSYEVAMELSSLYALKNQWERAYAYSEEARILFDSLNLQEQVRFSRELSEKFENDKKEHEITLLNTRNALNESKRKKTLIGVYLLIAVSLASLWIALLLRSRIQLSKKLEHERKQNRIAGDIEDERMLNQFVVSLFGKHTVSDLLTALTQSTVSHFGFWGGWVYTPNSSGDALVVHARADRQGLFLDGKTAQPTTQGAAGRAFTTGKSVLEQRPREGSGIAELAVPVRVNGKVFAVAHVEDATGTRVTERQLRLLERAAAVCSERISKLITEEKLRLHIARDLHDELGSTLTSISILSKLATNEADPKQATYLQKIHTYSGHMMESMSDIIWAINPSHDSMHEALLRMKEYAVDLIESAGMTCEFNVHGHVESNTLSAEERKYIYLIFREAVHNAVKYSKAQNISIEIAQSESSFSFTVEDDGVGFDLDQTVYGNGIHNIYDRAKAIHAVVQIKTTKGSGTVVELVKPTTLPE